MCFDRVVAERIARQPELIALARANLERWLTTSSLRVRPALLEWLTILNAGLAETDRMLRATTEDACCLRQSSPFAGEAFITREERNAIIRRFRS